MSATQGYKLFTPLRLNKDLVLKNRIVLSPMTRARSEKDSHVPNALNEQYYEQRASAGLIITEATTVSPQGFGWYGAPAIYTEAHAKGWKGVVDRVHAKGGKIFLQLWHMGRQAHSSFNSGMQIVSASAIGLPEGQIRNAKGEGVTYEKPRALETEEIQGVVDDFRKAAKLADFAGFDGVEIHAANGYLPDQFLQSVSNKRTDKYGGSIENRARFLLELVEGIQKALPADRVAVRISPNSAFGGMGSEDNYDQFMHTIEQLSKYGLAYLGILDGFGFGSHDKCRHVTAFDAKTAFKGTVIAHNSYTRDIAEGAVRSGAADAVGFGRLMISNPDLVERFQNDWPLNPDALHEHYWDANLGATGYVDYPAYKT